jgi:uncharacterized protein YajQ (UPF0234 family)
MRWKDVPRHLFTMSRDITFVGGAGFEPAQATPAILQTAPFGRSGTPPDAHLGYRAVAKASSFDIVSEVDMAEVTNAVDQARREIIQRFDFKNTGTSIEQDADLIELRSSTEDRLRAALEVLKDKSVRRKVSLKALHEGPVLPAARGTYRQTVNVNRGISEDKAREITKHLKGLGLKLQSQVQGDQIRVTGKSRDDLQRAIASLKERDFDIPLEFTNYR